MIENVIYIVVLMVAASWCIKVAMDDLGNR